MEGQFPPEEFTGFYYYDIDGDGLPYYCPVNPVHTVFALEGTDDAISAAAAIINDFKCDNFEGLYIKNMLGFRVFDIEINNFIADLYDDLKAIAGIKKVLYCVCDKAHERLITNDRQSRIMTLLDLPDYEPEIDDEDDMFPEFTELSLPTE